MHRACGWSRWTLAVLLVLALVATACSSDGGQQDGDGGTTDADTETGDESPATEAAGEADPEGVIRVALNFFRNQQFSLDPRIMPTSQQAEFLNQVYSTLAEFDPQSGEYSANLAEFEVVDPQTMRFTIREDALFHDGSPVTAEDAKASIEATRANTEEGTCNCNGGIALVESVEVDDERTFVVNTSEPALATLFELMVGPEFMISPADAGSEQATNPVGNGQFQFAEYVEGQQIVLEKFEEHWAADEVQLAGLEFVNLDPGNTQQNALLSGDVDYATELNLAAFETLEGRDGFTGLAQTNQTQYHFLNPCKSQGPWSSLELRQGFMKAMDREAINEAIYGGQGDMTAAMYPPGHPYYDPAIDEVHAHDPEAAAELFEQADVGDEPLGIWTTSGIAEAQDIVLLLDQQMSDLGLSLEPVATDDLVGDFLRPAIENPDSLEHYNAVNLQSRPGLQKVTRQFIPGEITNSCNFETPRTTEIIDELQGLAPDDPEAAELWQEIQMINAEQALWPIIGFFPSFSGYNSDLLGGVDSATFNEHTAGGLTYERMFVSE